MTVDNERQENLCTDGTTIAYHRLVPHTTIPPRRKQDLTNYMAAFYVDWNVTDGCRYSMKMSNLPEMQI